MTLRECDTKKKEPKNTSCLFSFVVNTRQSKVQSQDTKINPNCSKTLQHTKSKGYTWLKKTVRPTVRAVRLNARQATNLFRSFVLDMSLQAKGNKRNTTNNESFQRQLLAFQVTTARPR